MTNHNNASIMRIISIIDGIIRLILFLGAIALLMVYIWSSQMKYQDKELTTANKLFSLPPIAICLLGVLGAYFENDTWLNFVSINTNEYETHLEYYIILVVGCHTQGYKLTPPLLPLNEN